MLRLKSYDVEHLVYKRKFDTALHEDAGKIGGRAPVILNLGNVWSALHPGSLSIVEILPVRTEMETIGASEFF
jgi:hypothetical protein